MKKMIELKIEKPWIDCYTTYAHLLSILQVEERSYSWIYSNFIQVFINKDILANYWGEFYRPMPYELRTFDVCKWINVQKIRKELILCNRETLLNYVKNELENGFYVHLNIEHKYIKSFATNGHWHDGLVYGIDIENGKVLMQDVFKSGRYERKTLTLDEFLDSVMYCEVPSEEDYMNGMIYSYKIKNECDYEFNELNIWKTLKQYLEAVVPEYWELYNNSNKKNIVFGIRMYESIRNYINLINIEIQEIDVRPFYFLRDHFIIMKKCIEWLRENYYRGVVDYEQIICRYDRLLEDSNEINMILLLINKTKKDKKLKIITLIDKMAQIEKEIYSFLPILDE